MANNISRRCMVYLVAVLAVLTTITILQRGLDVRRQLKPLSEAPGPAGDQGDRGPGGAAGA